MRYAIVSLCLLAAGCSNHPPEAAPAGPKEAAPAGPKEAAPAGPKEAARAEPKDAVADLQAPAETPRLVPTDAPPIPQDPAKVARRKRERLEWHLRTSVGAYDKVGKKSPRWDDLARKAVDLAVRQSFEPGSRVTIAEIDRAAKGAVDAGCDDPLVAYIYAQASGVPTARGGADPTRLRRDAARAYAASRYPAFRRAGTLQGLASELLNDEAPDDAARKGIEATLDSSLALLSEGAKSDEHNGFWVDKWHDTIIGAIKDYRRLGVAAEAAYERADAKMTNIPELEELRLMVRGTFWLDYGWEARTTAFAPDVPADGFRLLEERLAIAKKAFEEAWKLRPDNAYAAVQLMNIDKGIEGDRATMELWFDRAMKADGDRRAACFTKLDWLDPKWYGSIEELLAFGRACRDTKNSRAGITLLVADAHWRIACKPGQDQNKYLASPDVWADIQTVYDEYLKHHPEDYVARSKYATFCHLSSHWREAEVQYVALGNDLTQWSEFPYLLLNQMKQFRRRNADVVLGKTGSITFPGWHFVRTTNDEREWCANFPEHALRQKKPGILGADASDVWHCTAGGLFYELRVLELPAARRNDRPERVLDAARAAFAEESGARPRNLRDTMLAARPAQEYEVDVPGPGPRQRRVKTIVIGNWLYELSVTASKSGVASKEANEFFDSFAVEPKAKSSAVANRQ